MFGGVKKMAYAEQSKEVFLCVGSQNCLEKSCGK